MRIAIILTVFGFLSGGCCATRPTVPQKMIVEFPVHAEQRPEFIAALNEILVDTRAFEGCLGVQVWTNGKDEDIVWLYEEWETRDHQAAYLSWRGETGNTSHLNPFINGDLRFLWLDEY